MTPIPRPTAPTNGPDAQVPLPNIDRIKLCMTGVTGGSHPVLWEQLDRMFFHYESLRRKCEETRVLLATVLDQIDGDVRASQWFDRRMIERMKLATQRPLPDRRGGGKEVKDYE